MTKNHKYYSIMFWATAVLLLAGCGKKKESLPNIVVVKTLAASVSEAAGRQSYTGTVEEQSGTSLSFAGAGTVRSLSVSEGRHVSAGQLIGVLDAQTTGNAVQVARAATRQAVEALRRAEDAHRRMKLLRDNGSLPEMKWVEVETQVSQAREMVAQARASEQIARKGMADTRLVAPFAGYIARKQAEVGQNVVPGQPIAYLVRIDRVKVKFSVPEDEVARFAVGQKVMFRVPSVGQSTYLATVSEKSVEADPVSRAYMVKAVLDNRGHRLLPGMVCDVYGSAEHTDAAITLPADLIQIDIDNVPFVWTVVGGKAHKARLVLGDNIGDRVEVRSGLAAGDRVIVEGRQKVSEGTRVKVG